MNDFEDKIVESLKKEARLYNYELELSKRHGTISDTEVFAKMHSVNNVVEVLGYKYALNAESKICLYKEV